MKNTQKGFGLLAAVLVVAALTAGSYAAVKINEEMHAEEATQQTSATSTATTTIDASVDAPDTQNASSGIMIGASTTLQLGN
jgi:hypothetical protein